MLPRKASKKYLKNKADRLFSEYIRNRDRKCCKCGSSTKQLQCAHIIGRRNLRLRYDPQNALTLCAGCHFWWHENPFDSTEWYKETYPNDWDYLSKARNEVEKPDYQEIIRGLQELL